MRIWMHFLAVIYRHGVSNKLLDVSIFYILIPNLISGKKSEVGFWVCDHVTLARAAVFEP